MKFNNNSLRKAIIEWNDNQQEAESEYGHISTWDTSEVTDMRFLFRGFSEFNGDVSNWNLSQVKNMRYMFLGCKKFNQAIRQWNVSQVTDMSYMFYDATAFNQDIGQWPIRGYCNVTLMFKDSGVSDQTFEGIYGNKIAGYFENNLKNPNEDAVWEPYTRWERRKNAVTLMLGLNRKQTLNTLQDLRRMVFNPVDTGRKIISFI